MSQALNLQQRAQTLELNLAQNPENLESLESALKVYQELGDYSKVYNILKKLEALKPELRVDLRVDLRADLQGEIFACLENITELKKIHCLEDLSIDLIHYKTQDHVDGNKVKTLCRKIILRHYQAYQGGEIKLAAVAADKLLLNSLGIECLFDSDIELFITDIRHQLLLNGVKQQAINADYIGLSIAIALQNHITEYIHYVSAEEASIVESLSQHLKQCLQQKVLQQKASQQKAWLEHGGHDVASDEKICGLLLLLAMYKPLSYWDQNGCLSRSDKQVWPHYLVMVLNATLYQPLDESGRWDTFPGFREVGESGESGETVSEIDNKMSKEIKQQYEENPFPRWLKLRYQRNPVPYIYCNKSLQTGFDAPAYMAGSELKILVAGCGTGLQAISLAKSCLNASIVAFDLSRASLAYAQRMAEQYAVENIHFMHGDILNLSALPQQFHIIECSGVLMYLEDPQQGLALLRQRLVPGGLLRLGLYSELARQRITQVRDSAAGIRRDPSVESLRQFRRKVFLTTEFAAPLRKELLGIVDFYTASGCRDLLFSWQEQRFSIADIKCLLANCQLQFIGFQLNNPQVEKDYLQMFPADKALNNLDYWQVFEQRYPDTFRTMYNFHCQAIE